MARILAALLFCAGIFCLGQSQAQMTLTGVGSGAFQLSYSGAGNIVSSAYAWWGLRCYNAAYAGNVADVYAPVDASHTLITCSAGGILNQTLQSLATTCAVSCTVKTLYDQSGNTNCAAAACNLVQATIANRPAFTQNCLNTSLPCMTFAGAATAGLTSAANPSVTQPYTISGVAQRTGTFTTNSAVMTGDGTSSVALYFTSSANTCGLFVTSGTSKACTDSAWHRMQGIVATGANSILVVDNSPTTAANLGATTMNRFTMGMAPNASLKLTGLITEVGVWPSAFTPAQYGSMDVSQKAYYGL